MMKGKKGLTLIELLVVVIVLGALAAIAIPRLSQSATTAKTRACQTNQDTMDTQIELYYSDYGSWPSTLETITEDVNYFPDGAPSCPADGEYTMSSDTHRVSCDATGH
jgi:prepilin-type N-terminal cleavage/methylation domain-containing protein